MIDLLKISYRHKFKDCIQLTTFILVQIGSINMISNTLKYNFVHFIFREKLI